MFTYRDFEMGTLGLAWTGDMKNAGGVCEKNGVSLCLFILFTFELCLLAYFKKDFFNNQPCKKGIVPTSILVKFI